jgi:glycosyltransferase involved in cell wall biosynthesis
MRILYTVQRYGESVVGGSEAAARAFAEHLARAGHEVEVATSCAQSYVDWANVFDPGVEIINDVTVHRLPVADLRRPERFGPIHEWMVHGPRPAPLFEQMRWAKLMGPDLIGYPAWMAGNIDRFDAAIFMTYMYSTTTRGLPTAAGRVPTIMQPTAHDEPPIWIRLYDTLFRLPDEFLFFTPEERDVVRRRFQIEPSGRTVGIGIDLGEPGDPAVFRRRFGLGEAPYLVYVGRIDAIKGSRELHDFFVTYKQRNGGDLRLVLVGEQIADTGSNHEVVPTGFLSEEDKRSAIAGSLALVQPSRFESFSIVVCEGWVQRRPVLVHADCDVLVGQARRSNGGLFYGGYAEFEAAVDLLLHKPELGDQLGRNGRAYVEANYSWDAVVHGVEASIADASQRFGHRGHAHVRAINE